MDSYWKAVFDEQVVVANGPRSRWKLPERGFVRVVDAKGKTLGLLLSREAAEDLEEDIAASSPEFRESLEESRRSGPPIPSEVVKKRLGLMEAVEEEKKRLGLK